MKVLAEIQQTSITYLDVYLWTQTGLPVYFNLILLKKDT